MLIGGSLNPGPLAPEVDASGRLDQIHDVGTAYAGSRFEKVKAVVVSPLDKFHVRCSTHHPESTEDFLVHLFQRLLLLRAAGKRAGGSNSSSVKHIEWWTSILMDLGKNNPTIDHQ